MDYLEGSHDIIDLFESLETGADSSMNTKNLVIDDSDQGEVLKHVVDDVEDRSWGIGVFLKSSLAFVQKAKIRVDPFVLVVSPKKVNLVREFDLKSHQETDRLEGVVPSIDIVSQEDVVVGILLVESSLNLRVAGPSNHVEESHQI